MTTADPPGLVTDSAEALAEALAKHRYEKYDSHFSMPGGISWEEYKADDPEGADGVYLADARDDLAALLAPGAVRFPRGVEAVTLTEFLTARIAEDPFTFWTAILDMIEDHYGGATVDDGLPAYRDFGERGTLASDLAAAYADHPDYREDWRP